MTKTCTIHNVEMTERESKTKFDEAGNPKTYFAHNEADGKLCFGGEFKKTLVRPTNLPPKPSEEAPDWDGIARGKIRSLFIEAHITKNGMVRLNEAELMVLDELTNLAMTGK